MTKKYDAQDIDKVVTAVRRYYEGNKRTRDQSDPDDTIEIHNHVPGGEDYAVNGENITAGDEAEENGVVARYPATYHAATEGNELVIYSKAPQQKTDIYNFDRAAQDSQPPQTLRQMNAYLRDYYPRKRTTAAR
jgi:hypothetical protein